ncbi:MAG TPA: dTDP-4-dehydrorhamnose reductase [Firmicutes bacterium]|jgi:dTDP-4-dehydrorhamnose reductase|nr:dTDP-4-dehydrorhamnose reductase [Bacillota bacterium]
MNILITGANGQLGNALREILKNEKLRVTDLPELNLTLPQDTLDYILMVKPEVVIHCAAKTNVDECEMNPTAAYLENVLATKNVVNACQIANSILVYISTDYVFDGCKNQPYHEYDFCKPINIYGKTKWQGEEIVKMHLDKFFIVRTAWLFGDIGHNFVKTILRLADERKPLPIVNDQVGSPTYALDLAAVIAQLIQTKAYGIYHITNTGNCSWFEYAKQILRYAGQKDALLKPITSEKLNRPAPRPSYSILAQDALNLMGITMPSYQDALQRYFTKVNHSSSIIKN